MKIIVPAYNVQPEQAARFEAQIADIMHRMRNAERNVTADLPDDSPMRRAERIRPESKPTQSNRDRPLTPTDTLLISLLKGKDLTATEIMNLTYLNRDTLRAALIRLAARGLLIKRVRGNHISWTSVGEQHGA